MNLNLKLEINPKTLLPLLRKVEPLLFGLALVGLFGYTAYAVNQALNVQPSVAAPTISAAPKISFDKNTISSLKTLDVVGGDVPLGDLGKDDPFK